MWSVSRYPISTSAWALHTCMLHTRGSAWVPACCVECRQWVGSQSHCAGEKDARQVKRFDSRKSPFSHSPNSLMKCWPLWACWDHYVISVIDYGNEEGPQVILTLLGSFQE